MSTSSVLISDSERSIEDSLDPRLECSPEMGWLIRAARQAISGSNRLWNENEQRIDEARLLELAELHGVAPLLCRALDSEAQLISGDAFAQLQAGFRNIARANLLRVRELLRVVQALGTEGVTVVPYKGPVLSAAVYGDVTLREFSDLDLLIHPADIEAARQVLGQLGYVAEQILSPRAEQRYLRSACEYHFKHRELGILLELHWQILPRQFSMRFDLERMWSRLESFELGAASVRSLSAEDLLIVLSAHAAKHLWGRLIWIADIAGLVLRNPELDWDGIRSEAAEIGAHRIVLISVAVACQMFALTLPPGIQQAMACDRGAQNMAREIVTRMLRSGPGAGAVFPIQHHVTLLRARESWDDRVRYACRTFSASVRARLSAEAHHEEGAR